MTQIVTDGVHTAAEHLRVDLLGKLRQVTAILEELPFPRLGVTVQHVTLVLLDPCIHLRGLFSLAERQ